MTNGFVKKHRKRLRQKLIAQRTGIDQTESNRLENCTRNQSIKLLQRLAEGMGMVRHISFEPKKTTDSVV